ERSRVLTSVTGIDSHDDVPSLAYHLLNRRHDRGNHRRHAHVVEIDHQSVLLLAVRLQSKAAGIDLAAQIQNDAHISAIANAAAQRGDGAVLEVQCSGAGCHGRISEIDDYTGRLSQGKNGILRLLVELEYNAGGIRRVP